MRCSALLLQSITWLFFSNALLCRSVPTRCFAIFSFPVLGMSSPRHCPAFLFQSVALPFFSDAMLCPSSPKRCSAFLIQHSAQLFFSKALWCISDALRVQALPQLCGLLHILRAALPCGSYPGHFIALHCPALPSLSERCQCYVLLCPSAAWLCRCVSKHSLFGAYPLGPLPAPFSPW